MASPPKSPSMPRCLQELADVLTSGGARDSPSPVGNGKVGFKSGRTRAQQQRAEQDEDQQTPQSKPKRLCVP